MLEMNIVLAGSTVDMTVSLALKTGVLPVSETVGVTKLDELSTTEEGGSTVGSLVALAGKTALEIDKLNWRELAGTAEVPFAGLGETL